LSLVIAFRKNLEGTKYQILIYLTCLFPLGYDTTISWSSSIPQTVPEVPKVWKKVWKN